MATRYSDLLRLRESKPAYNIQLEESGEWNTFIANDQFNEILRKIISAVRNDNKDLHKSFWIEGTYGSGKSHAGAVITHLLTDPVEAIHEWVDEEYKAGRHSLLRNSIYDLRKEKRLFPVCMEGSCNISHREDLSLAIQKAVKQALKAANIDIVVKTDFDNYAEHVEANPELWDIIISKSGQLQSVTPDRQKLIRDLRGQDTNTLARVNEAMRTSGIDVRLTAANLQDWFFEVQAELRKLGTYNGLLVVWDEFTNVMTSDIGLSLLVDIQNMTEAAMRTENDSYFFFISHPSALNNLKAEEREKTKGRYHYMKYNMEPVSAFKIMSRKFIRLCDEPTFKNTTALFHERTKSLIDACSSSSTSPEETAEDIRCLFPLHPATANLATYFAREAGSSNRSVFEFLGDNEAIRTFLDDEQVYLNRTTITADYLWDYVLTEFEGNVQRYGVVTERYNSFRLHAKQQGYSYEAVFKGTLLLNALNNLANNDSVTPSEDNIRNLFLGTAIEEDVDRVLAAMNEQGVIQRSPAGLYSVQFSALPMNEISNIKAKLTSLEFKYTYQVMRYGDVAQTMFDKSFSTVMRPYQFAFYSVDANEYTLLNKIENGKRNSKGYELFFAILVARNNDEVHALKDMMETKVKDDGRFENTIFLLYETAFGNDSYDRFIEYMANAKCAQQHGFMDQQKANADNAADMIKKWIEAMRRGNITLYLRGESQGLQPTKLVTAINTVISPIIFSSGAESLEIIRHRSTQTCWQKAMVKQTIINVLTFNTKQDIIDHCRRNLMHVTYLLQDSVDENLEWKPDVDPKHPLKLVCDFVDEKIKHSYKNVPFNMVEKFEELTRPPYGLYPSHAGMGMLAFAMRKYADKVFDTNGKPRTAQHLVEDVLETFECWDKGTTNTSKGILKFETLEERDLRANIVNLFGLQNLKGYSDISSLKDARWAINHEFIRDKGYPLWSLKYITEDMTGAISCNVPEDVRDTFVDNIITICRDVNTPNPSLMSTTLNIIKEHRFELRALISQPQNYSTGFINFLKGVEKVSPQDEEVEEAIAYIRQHAQGDVWSWSEELVKEQLKNWWIEKHTPKPTPTPPPTPQPTPPTPVPIPPEKEKKARERVQAMSREELAAALTRLIEQGNQGVIDILTE